MASRIAGITVEINGDTTGLQSALKNVNSTIKTTNSALKDVNSLLKLDPTNVTLITQKQKNLTTAISETKTKLDTLKTAAEQANEQLANGEITQEQYDALQREIASTELKLEELQTQAATTNATLAKIEAVGTAFTTVGDKIAAVGTKLTTLVTGPIAAVAAAAISTTSDFETSMSSVEALISSTSDDIEGDMERLEEAAREAGSSTKYSASEAADALYYMGLAGWDTSEMIDGLSGVLNLAAASDMDLATASDIVTDNLTAFGMSASQSQELVDKMAYAMSNSNTTTEQLGEAYKNCAATSTQLGYSLDDTTAALMVMADGGIKGGEAGTALASIMTRLGNNTSGCRDMLEEYGIEVYDAEGNVNSLSSILEGMQDVWADLTDEEKSNLAYVVAGKTAQSELMTVLGDSTGSFEEYKEGLSSCSGTAEEMAEIMQQNLSGQITILLSKLQELAISFGEILMPTVMNIIYKLQDLVDWLNNLDDGTKETIVKVAALAAAIGPLLLVVGKLTSGIGKTLTKVSSFAKSIATLGVKIAGGSGMITSFSSAISAVATTIGPVILVIGTLVAAFVTLWTTNEEFRDKITSIWNAIVEKVQEFVSGVQERFAEIEPALSAVVEILKALWNGFCDVLAPVFETAFAVVSTVLSGVLDGLTGILDIFIGVFTGDWSQAWQGVQEVFGAIWNTVTGLLSNALDLIAGLIDAFLGWFGTDWSSVWNAIKTTVSTILSAIKTTISTVFTAIKTTISTVVNAIKSTISTVFNAIKSTISTVVNSIKSTVTSVFTAIKSAITTPVNAVKSTVSSAFTAIKSSMTSPIQSAYSTLTTILTNIKNKFTSIFTSVKTTVSNAISAVKKAFNFTWSLPTLKLPHVSISGKFSLSPLSVPTFSVKWYDQGGIFSSPSVIGVGEKRPEFVGALDDLRAIVREEAGSTAMINAIVGMTSLMEAYLPYLAVVANKEVTLTLDGKQVGKTVTKYISSTQAAKTAAQGA